MALFEVIMRRQINRMKNDNGDFERYMRTQAARYARREIINNIADDNDLFLVGSYTMYKDCDEKVVLQLVRYAGYERAEVKAVPIVGSLVDCVNVIHGVGFRVVLNNDS
ncbi:hypothetical protein vBValMR11Z_62 [Vibrio phage vB_ValM_R11Z]|nr:hypothetical protein vBValMR11Z_62 [Vibrio phage vB_ValM_R11Z]